MSISIIAAILHGAVQPTLVLFFGRVIDQFSRLFLPESDPAFISFSELPSTISDNTTVFLLCSFFNFFISFVQQYCALTAATSISNNMRQKLFKSLMAQDREFYDDADSGSLTNLLISDVNHIEVGVGDKFATTCQHLSTVVIGVIYGFVFCWRLTCVLLAAIPVLLVTGFMLATASARATGNSLGSYGQASAVATEVLGLIRTVTAFGAQKEEIKRYNTANEKACYASCKAALFSGIGMGISVLFTLLTFGLAMWYGGILVKDHGNSPGDVFLTFFAIFLGTSALSLTGTAFKLFSVARAAAPRVFETIDRISPIDPMDDEGGIVPNAPLQGHISFENVQFNYRNRSAENGDSSYVLNNFCLDIPAGSSEALVGHSGCGKSTITKLIQRCYDPQGGRILLDGVDLKEFNVRWLRSQIGIVSQMPSLFMLTIRENIALGAGLEMSINKTNGKRVFKQRKVTDAEIIAAAEMANAHNFIKNLPEGYDTLLGERGAQLSGGQKQRICIARALIRNPKVLLLDESTASLDTASERLVQDALEKAATGRTTITIAHRLSTVRKSDAISCIEGGTVIERGSHTALVSNQDSYYKHLNDFQNVQRVKLEEEKAQDVDGGSDYEVPLTSMMEGSKMGYALTKLDSLDKKSEKAPGVDDGLFLRSLKFNISEWPYMIGGTLGAILVGLVFPLSSIALVHVIQILVQTEVDMDQVGRWSLAFVVLGIIAFIGFSLQYGVLGVSGELLAKKLRSRAFESLLQQEMGYFDMKENSIGALTGHLSSDSGVVKGLTGDLYGTLINVICSSIAGLTISVVNCWRVTLVVLSIIPGILLSGYFQMRVSMGTGVGNRNGLSTINTTAAEAVGNVNTVQSLGIEQYFEERFRNNIMDSLKLKRRQATLTGIGFGFSEFCQNLMWYATFKAGGNFVSAGHCTFIELLQATLAIIFSARTLGNTSVFAPDVAASKIAATHIYRLIDRKSEIDPTSLDGIAMKRVYGRIAVDDVHFEYPSRSNVPVLRGLTLEISTAKTLALVGPSGHGKSTIISLLERFYGIRDGRISIDEQDISTTIVQDLRSHIGHVPQEPQLFNRSIYDNIIYGLCHEDGTPVSMADVKQAAREANADEFIEALPQGYNTLVGERGESLSGGQRQRVAIARSLIRRPPVLLLDEATSALDGESEHLVHEALIRAGAERTTILVAHRLSTIRSADVIAVVRNGKIVECGTHDVLLNRNGAYAKLVEHQLAEV